MVKIEMAPRLDGPTNQIVTDEYIWLTGQPWPVPDGQDKIVNRIEVFGPELNDVREFPGGEIDGVKPEVMKQWKVKEARYISEQMRKKLADAAAS